MSYIDVEPDTAASAARATAATSDTWDAWAGRSAQALRNAADGANDPVVRGAFESFLTDLNPRLQGVAHLAERQGVNLGAAVATAVDTDLAQGSAQRTGLDAAQQQGSTLNRPVNAV